MGYYCVNIKPNEDGIPLRKGVNDPSDDIQPPPDPPKKNDEEE